MAICAKRQSSQFPEYRESSQSQCKKFNYEGYKINFDWNSKDILMLWDNEEMPINVTGGNKFRLWKVEVRTG